MQSTTMITLHQDANLHLLKAAESAAKEAGDLISHLFRKQRIIEHKGTFDLVTDADKAANLLISKKLAESFPDSLIMAEENRSIADDIIKRHHSDLVWIIDPIDGTTNYARRIPHAAISIAAYRPKEAVPIVGVVYDPFRGECFTAALGQGAYLNGERIMVSTTASIEKAIVATGFGYDKAENPDNNLAEFNAFCPRALGMRRFGAASLDLAYVAMGRFDAYFEQHLAPWDIAAGMLIVSEAGGHVSTYAGNTLDPFMGHILASNLALHEQLIEVIADARHKAGFKAEPS